MSAPQPLKHSVHSVRVHQFFIGLATLLAISGVTPFLPPAHAQGQVSLVTLATDQTPLNLSNHFGVPNNAVVNQNGDYAFIGEGFGDVGGHGEGSALFLRLHGASAATRLLQFGDSVPGITGATAVEFLMGGLNKSANLAFGVDYTVSPPDGQLHRAILVFNSSADTYSTVTSSDTVAAGSGGLTFGPNIAFAVQGSSLDDNGDVLFDTSFQPFAGTDTMTGVTTYYIAPAGGTPVRILGQGDAVPGLSGATFAIFNGVSQINALGQFLFLGEYVSGGTLTSALYLGSVSGLTKVVANGDTKPGGGTFTINTSLSGLSGELNDLGQVAFVNLVSPESVWLYSGGTLTTTAGSTSTFTLTGLSNLGSAVGYIGTSLSRILSTGVVDTIASPGQAAPGTSATFSTFSSASTDNNDRVIFNALLSNGSYGVYQQTGTSAPVAIALEGQSTGLSGGGTFDLSAAGLLAYKALDNGSTLFSSTISGGAANFAEFLGTAGNLQALMSTADTLPAGARVRLSLPASNSENEGNDLFVSFAASLAGGQTAIFVKDIDLGTTTRVVGEGDAIAGLNGATLVLRATPSGIKPFYMNASGTVAFPAVLTGNQLAILSAGPDANSVTAAAVTGQAISGVGTFSSLDFSDNWTSLSPINVDGQIGFYGTLSTGVTGIFLYTPGVGISPIAESGATVPEGGATFTLFNGADESLAVNDNGQVAFGANKTTGSGFYIGTAGGTPTKVVNQADLRPPLCTATFSNFDPISGFNNSGQIVFEPGNGGGVFMGVSGPAAPNCGVGTVTAVTTDGTANPGTGGGTIATSTPGYSTTNFSSFFSTTNAAIDNSGDVVFQSRVTGGSANSGYFQVLNDSGSPGPLQADVLQGQVVAGVGTLGTMFSSTAVDSFFSLGNDESGLVTFTNSFTNASDATMVGQFFSVGPNFAQKLMVPGDAVAGTGGGTYAAATTRSQSGANTPTYEVLTTGGTASQSIVFAVVEGGTVPTTTTVASELNPSGVGALDEFTATVTSSQGPPQTGDIVAFFDGGVEIGTGFTDDNGNAIFTTSSLSAGSHSITAHFFSNSCNSCNSESLEPSTSAPLTQVVSNATTSELFSFTNPSLPNESVEFEVVVFPSAASSLLPTGTVTFYDGATQIGTVTLADEEATFSTSSLSSGTHIITAQYSGDSNFAGTTSNAVNQVVQTTTLPPSATVVASSANPSVSGQSVTFTAVVNGSSGVAPTGSVNFLDGATVIGSAIPLTTSGTIATATFTTSSLSVGSHNIAAYYTGDANFSASLSQNLVQVVQSGTVTTPTIQSLSTNSGPVGTTIVITGTNFGASQSQVSGSVSVNGVSATVTSWAPTSITVSVPSTATGTGNVVVTVSGVASATNSSTGFTVTSGVAATCAGSPSGQESILSGRWVVMVQGWYGTGPGSPDAVVLSFDAAGNGSFVDVSGGSGITGNVDHNFGNLGTGSVLSGNVLTAGSSYNVGLDPTNNTGYVGCMALANSSGATAVLRFTLSVTGGNALRGRVIRWIDASGNGSGNRGSGVMLPQDTTAFSSGTLSNLSSNYAFGEDGSDVNGGHFAVAGSLNLNTTTGQASATIDSDDAGAVTSDLTESPAITGLSSMTGRALSTVTPPGSTTPVHSAVYIVNANELFVIGIDPYVSGNSGVYSGRAIATGTSFSNASLSGNYVYETSGGITGNSSCNSSLNCAKTTLGVLNFNGSGTLNGADTSTLYSYTMGTLLTINPSGAYSVAAAGRLSVPSANSVLYLATPQPNTDAITAFVVGTDASAQFGAMEAGANSNVSTSSLAGNYIGANIDPGDSTIPDSVVVAQVAGSGSITGYQYQSDTTGLSDGSITGGVTITNSPLPGIGNFGPGDIAVTNGTRTWFMVTGTADTSPARMNIIEPTTLSSAPTIQSLSAGAAPTGTPITITGTNFGPSQSQVSGTVTVNGVAVGAVSDWSPTSITVTVPLTATGTGDVVVTVLGVASNGVSFTVTPSILPSSTALASSVNPSTQGQSVTFTAVVDGSNAGTPTGTVTFFDGSTQIGTGTLSTTSGVTAATFSTSSLAVGSHSITGAYSGDTNFSPSSSNVVVQVVQVAASGGCTSNCQLSGTVTGPWVYGVAITLTGPSPSTAVASSTTTNANGSYGFTGLTAGGTYTVVPTLAGYSFSPSAPQVTISSTSVTQNFVASSALASYSISGTVSYSGAKTGNTLISVFQNNCTYCYSLAGTSLSTAPTQGGLSYTIRGLSPGSYVVVAEVDTFGNGVPNSSDPEGMSAAFTITSSNVTLPNIAVADRTPPAAVAPPNIAIAPSSGTVQISYAANHGAFYDETASSYKLYYGTSSTLSTSSSVTIPPGNADGIYYLTGLTNGSQYYFQMSAVNSTGESNPKSPIVGPVTIGALTGGNTVSGTVTLSGITPTGPLYVVVYNYGLAYLEAIPNPSASQAYTISGIPSGNYQLFAFIDMNGDGIPDTGDITNSGPTGNSPPISVPVSGPQPITLTAANATTFVETNHYLTGGSNTYNINVGTVGETKLPVSMTLFSGPNVAVPFDVANLVLNYFNPVFASSVSPSVGDTYQFLVTYSDGSTQVFSSAVNAVLNSFAQNLDMNVPAAGTATIPVLNWAAPAAPPPFYYYSVGLYNTNGSLENWYYYGGAGESGIPSTQTNVLFNVDGSASPSPSLTPGTTYGWYVAVEDFNFNSALDYATYTVPSTTVPPTVSKAFGANAIVVNGTTTLTFTINNPNATSSLTGISFTDALTGGLQVASDSYGDTCGGTVAGVQPGFTSVTQSGVTLAAGASCTFSVTVTGTVAGTINNTTGNITSNEGGTGGTSNTATLLVIASPPTVQSLSTNSGSAGTQIIITGTNFGASQSQASGSVTINGVSVGIVPSSDWSPTSITVTVPAGAAGTGNIVVTVLGVASNGVSFTVTTPLLPSSTALASSVNPSVSGQLVTFVAPVDGSQGGTPTGTVTFLDGTTQIGTGTIASGQATFSTSSLAVGTHSITAVYGGDANFTGSTSNVVSQVVTTAVTTSTSISPRFAFAANEGTNNISAYTVDAGTGALTPAPGSPFATGAGGSDPFSVSADPLGRFVYVADSAENTISVFSVNALTGVLTSAPGSPFNTGGNDAESVTADPSGHFVYVASYESTYISAFSVDATTGALTPVPGSPFNIGLNQALSVTADPLGRFIYLAIQCDSDGCTSGTVVVFSLNSTTGALTLVPGSPFITGGLSTDSVSADPSGRFVYVSNQCQTCQGGSTVSAFSVNAMTGALAPVAGSPFATGGTYANSVSVDPLGRFVYVTDFVSDVVSVFSLNSSTGALTPVAGSPFPAQGKPSGPTSVSADPTGLFVYVANVQSNTVSVFSVNGTTGALTPVAGSPFASGGALTESVAAFGAVSNPNATLESLTVQPQTATVAVGNTQQFTAVGMYSDGSTRFLTNSATWASSDGTATVSNTSGGAGLATGVAQGNPNITASLNGVTSSPASLTVTSVLQSLVVTPTSPSITVSNTISFAATGVFSDGSMLDETPSVTWNSSASNVASIDSTGTATGLLGGQTTTITAQLGSVISSPVTLTVSSATLVSIAVTPITPFTPTSTAQPFTASGTYSDGSVADLTSKVTWGSTTQGAATISAAGLATTGSASGTTTISATLGSVNNSTTLTVTQSEAPPQSFHLAFFGNTGSPTSISNNVSDYSNSFAGTFQVAGTALGVPNNLVLYRDPAFASFDAPIYTGIGYYDFNSSDVLSNINNNGFAVAFPGDAYPFNSGTKTDPVQGLRMDATGAPLRFDTPSSLSGSSSVIRYFNSGPTPGPELTLVANDSFNYVMLNDGTLLQSSALDGQNPVGNVGNWTFNGGPGDTTVYSGVYVIYPVEAITSANNTTFTVGTAGSFKVTAVGYPTSLSESGTLPNGVSFNDNGDGTGTLSGVPALGYAGTYNFTVTASNGVDPNAVQSFTLTVVTLSPIPTSTLLVSSANPSLAGQGVTFTATVSATVGGTPTGSVNFTVGDDQQTYTGTLNASGQTTFNASPLSAGSYTVTAQYTGDQNFTGSTSNTVTQVVNAAPTTTTVSSSLNPSVVGQSVTFTATVTSTTGGSPTGTVNFVDNTTDATIGTGTLSNGQATVSTSSLGAGSHSITAQYTGATDFASSPSSPLSQVVSLNPSDTALTSSLNPAAFGQSIVLTAIVYSPNGGTPTGSVNFVDNSTESQIGSSTLVAGVATFTTSSLTLGSHSITAQYAGSANFAPSTSAAVQETINHGPTTTAIASSINPSVATQTVQFSAIVTSSTGETPAGTVTFFDGATSIGSGALNAAGVATFTTSSLGVGSHSITAQYPSGAIFNGSTSAPLTQTVTINSTSTSLISSLNPSPSTDFVQFSAIVTSSSGGIPAGTVNFIDNTADAQIGSSTLNASGVATFGTSTLSVGNHSITAQYVGNSSFTGSASATLVQTVTVNATPTTTPTFVAINSSPNPSAVGQAITITATVSSSNGGTPTGNVTFLDNGAPLTNGVVPLPVGSTIATYSTSSLAAGSHPLTAQYSGDANFALSLSPVLSQTVGSGSSTASSVQVTPIPTNVASNTTVPFTATVTNGGTNPTVTWQLLTGPGSLVQTGGTTANYIAPSSAPSSTPVTISASIGGSSATVTFTIAADALTTNQPPATVAAGAPLSVTVQLAGVPTTSTVPFTLSCGSLPAATSCTFTNPDPTTACPNVNITFVTGACPNFTVNVITSGSTSQLVPVPTQTGRPWPGTPWLMLFAAALSTLGFAEFWRGAFLSRRSYACCALVLLCVSLVFLTSCSVFPSSTSVEAPALVPVTPSGSYQVVVLATPPSGAAGGGFVQTQLIVPVLIN